MIHVVKSHGFAKTNISPGHESVKLIFASFACKWNILAENEEANDLISHIICGTLQQYRVNENTQYSKCLRSRYFRGFLNNSRST